MIRGLAIFSLLVLVACQGTPRQTPGNFPPPGQGQYVRPDYLNPVPPPEISPVNACQSHIYQGLIGQPEGAIYMPGLPGAKRVLKPAYEEGFEYEDGGGFVSDPPYMEVRDYLPGQVLYAPSIRTSGSIIEMSDFDVNRLTIELDQEGLVQEIRCG